MIFNKNKSVNRREELYNNFDKTFQTFNNIIN